MVFVCGDEAQCGFHLVSHLAGDALLDLYGGEYGMIENVLVNVRR